MSRDNIVSAVASLLQAFKAIPGAANIADIQFGDLTKDPVEIKVFFKEEVEVLKF